jgi:predicted aminopeptidase
MKTSVLIIIFSITFLVNGCSLFYVAKQGVYQLSLISGAEPIEIALRSKDLDVVHRKKLELIIDVRSFAVSKLHLTAHKNYKDINLSWDKVIHTVSASEPWQFKPYQWWFPIIGSVPYKGFFDERDALQEEARLKAQGLDTQTKPIQGYSTLGFFADPVWPNMLKLSDHVLIELIIHELAHATIYIPSQTSFNETLANFIGTTGARSYIKDRFGDSSNELVKLDNYYNQLAIYRTFFYNLYQQLDAVYNSDITNQQKEEGKINLLNDAKNKYLKLPIDDGFKKNDWSHVNNAYLLSFKRYNHDDSIFDNLLSAVKGDFNRFIEEVSFYGLADDPFLSLKNRITALRGKS